MCICLVILGKIMAKLLIEGCGHLHYCSNVCFFMFNWSSDLFLCLYFPYSAEKKIAQIKRPSISFFRDETDSLENFFLNIHCNHFKILLLSMKKDDDDSLSSLSLLCRILALKKNSDVSSNVYSVLRQTFYWNVIFNFQTS